MKKRRQKNKITPKGSQQFDTFDISMGNGIEINGHYYSPLYVPYSTIEHKDNNGHAKYGNGCYYKYNKIRVPSLKRSLKVWRNFYKMFPRVYLNMQKHVSTQRDGDVIEISMDEIYNDNKVKLKVINNLDITCIDNLKINGWVISENGIEKGLEQGYIKKIKKI